MKCWDERKKELSYGDAAPITSVEQKHIKKGEVSPASKRAYF